MDFYSEAIPGLLHTVRSASRGRSKGDMDNQVGWPQ